MTVEVFEDSETSTITIYHDDLRVQGDGADYTEALINFAGELENLFDEAKWYGNEETLVIFSSYLPNAVFAPEE